GPPGVTGTGTIPAGQPFGTLTISAKREVPMGPHALTVQGKATINGKAVTQNASVRTVASQALANLPFPPRTLFGQIGLGVRDPPPFQLAVKFDQPEAVRGLPAGLTITAAREPGFAEEIVLAPGGLPPNVAPMLKNIPKGQNEVKVQLTPAAAAPL